MELTPEMIKQIQADLPKAKTYEDLMSKNWAIKKMIMKGTDKISTKETTERSMKVLKEYLKLSQKLNPDKGLKL